MLRCCELLVQGDGLLADYDSYDSSPDIVGYSVIVLQVLLLDDLSNILSALMVTMAYSVEFIVFVLSLYKLYENILSVSDTTLEMNESSQPSKLPVDSDLPKTPVDSQVKPTPDSRRADRVEPDTESAESLSCQQTETEVAAGDDTDSGYPQTQQLLGRNVVTLKPHQSKRVDIGQ